MYRFRCCCNSILAAGAIGGSNDSVNNNKVTNDLITNSLTNISNENWLMKTKQDVGANQVFKLKTGSITSSGSGSKCNISVDQKTGVNVHSVLQAVTELNNQQLKT